MEGWVDLGYPVVHWPGVELATSRSQVEGPTTRHTLPSHPLNGHIALCTPPVLWKVKQCYHIMWHSLTSKITRHRTVNRHRLGHDGFLNRSEARCFRHSDVVNHTVFLLCLLKVRRDGFLKLSNWKSAGRFRGSSNSAGCHLSKNTFSLQSIPTKWSSDFEMRAWALRLIL